MSAWRRRSRSSTSFFSASSGRPKVTRRRGSRAPEADPGRPVAARFRPKATFAILVWALESPDFGSRNVVDAASSTSYGARPPVTPRMRTQLISTGSCTAKAPRSWCSAFQNDTRNRALGLVDSTDTRNGPQPPASTSLRSVARTASSTAAQALLVAARLFAARTCSFFTSAPS